MKPCTKCRAVLPPQIFSKGRSECKDCVSKYYKQYRKNNLKRIKEIESKYRSDPKNDFKLKRQAYLLKCKDKILQRYLKKQYGLTIENFNDLNKKQKGVCAVCKNLPDSRLFVDHDHSTGRIRGLVCNRCNRAMGLFKDDYRVLMSAAMYLRPCLETKSPTHLVYSQWVSCQRHLYVRRDDYLKGSALLRQCMSSWARV